MFLCPPMNHSRFYVYAQKKARTKLCLFASEVFDYLAPNIRVKPTPNGVSVIALLLVLCESVEVSEARIKAKRFSNMSKMCVSYNTLCSIGKSINCFQCCKCRNMFAQMQVFSSYIFIPFHSSANISVQASATERMISKPRLRGMRMVSPTMSISSRVGWPWPLTVVACSPL